MYNSYSISLSFSFCGAIIGNCKEIKEFREREEIIMDFNEKMGMIYGSYEEYVRECEANGEKAKNFLAFLFA